MQRNNKYSSGGKRYNNDGQGQDNYGGTGRNSQNQQRSGDGQQRQDGGQQRFFNQEHKGNFSKQSDRPDYNQQRNNPESNQQRGQNQGRPKQENANWEEVKFSRPQGNQGQGRGGFNQRPQQSSNSGYHQSDKQQYQDSGYQGGSRGRGGYEGGRGGRGGYQGGRGGFAGGQKNAVVPASKSPYNVNLISNQFRLTLGQNLIVYQYVLEIKPDEFWEAAKVHAIIRTKRMALEKALGLFVVSGKTIYTLNEIDETLEWNTNYRNQVCTIKIDKSEVTIVNLSEDFNNKDNSVAQNLINIIVKQGFRDTSLKQIGRSPRFFDVSNPIDLPRQGLKIWSGFKASAFNSESGITLAIDSIFKFMSTTSCLQRMTELYQQTDKVERWKQMVRAEFAQKSIIADWGNKRTYIVFDVDFDKNPVSHRFMYNDKMISVAEYFSEVYDKKVTDCNQPLFLVKVTDQDYYLPPEFCMLDGVPDSIRKSAGMREALAQTRIMPAEKMSKIQEMCDLLFKQKSIKEWGLDIARTPLTLESHVLGAPQIFANNSIIHCDESVLRKLPIQEAVDLLNDEWIMIYQKNARRDNFQIADRIYNDIIKASRQLKIVVEEPYWIELEDEGNDDELRFRLQEYMMDSKSSEFRHPKLCLAVLGREQNYKGFKNIFEEFLMPSQVVTCRNGQSFNLSKATNVIKQMNSKMGGNLYTMKFPDIMKTKRTMLIGIDVCHSGPNSVVGFAASTNVEMSQYYSEFIIQKKGQEIVQSQMKDAIKNAIEVFASKHTGEYPTNFIIYRDGLGDAQRDLCLSKEIPQFQQAINELYNKVQNPQITLIVVNKRITQRFFVLDQQGKMINPPNGCIIDRGLVEKSGTGTEDKIFDFFMTPASATQGCVLPTHFHVPLNESNLAKLDIQQLTYSLCHFYFNWAGPIKVPAPCQYAHKIAEFYMTIGATRGKKKNQQRNCNSQQPLAEISANVQKLVEPLNKKLHFL